MALRGVELARELDLARGGRVRRYLCLAPARCREIYGAIGRYTPLAVPRSCHRVHRRYLAISPYISLPAIARIGEVRLLHDGEAPLVELERALEPAALEVRVALLLALLLQPLGLG